MPTRRKNTPERTYDRITETERLQENPRVSITSSTSLQLNTEGVLIRDQEDVRYEPKEGTRAYDA